MSGTAEKPQISDCARRRSLDGRQRRSKLHDQMIWNAIFSIACFHEPKSLKAYAAFLNEYGYKSARGKEWTTSTLSHVFKAHNTTPKEFTTKISEPSHQEPQPSLPEKMKDFIHVTTRRFDERSAANGNWILAIDHAPSYADVVRHSEFGEGQFVKETSVGKLRCRFCDFDLSGEDAPENEDASDNEDASEGFVRPGTFDVIIPAAQIEVFVFKRSREERIRLSDEIWESAQRFL